MGLIYFDLTNATKSCYTIKSHRYSKRVVELVSKINGDYPKELLVVWWA